MNKIEAQYRIKAVKEADETASGIVVCKGSLSKKRKGSGRIVEIYFPFGPRAQIISNGANLDQGFFYGNRNSYIQTYRMSPETQFSENASKAIPIQDINLTELQSELVGDIRQAVYENLDEILKTTNRFREFRDANPNSSAFNDFQKILGDELPGLKELALKEDSFYYGYGPLIPFNYFLSKPKIRTISIPFGGMTRQMKDDWRRKLP